MRWILIAAIPVCLLAHHFIARAVQSPPVSPAVQAAPLEAAEITAFEEKAATEEGLKYFDVTVKGADGSVKRIFVKVRSSLIEDWTTKTIKSRLPW